MGTMPDELKSQLRHTSVENLLEMLCFCADVVMVKAGAAQLKIEPLFDGAPNVSLWIARGEREREMLRICYQAMKDVGGIKAGLHVRIERGHLHIDKLEE